MNFRTFRRSASVLVLLYCAVMPLAGQQPPAFEVASVKRNISGVESVGFPRFRGTSVIATNAPVEMLISAAYSVPSRDIVEAPGWTLLDFDGGDRYDVAARAAEGSSVQDQRAMLRTLLEQRFGLRTRRELRQLPVYILRKLNAGGTLGPNLRPAAKDCLPRAACEGQLSTGHATYKGAQWSIVVQAIEVGFDERLVDQTGLSGIYDFELTYNYQGLSLDAADTGVDIFGAVQQQFGLKLDRGRAPYEVLVVESARRPTEN